MSFADAKIEQTGLNSYHVSHGEDKSLHVEFRMEPVRQGAASESAGRNIFKDTPYITINFPGDRTKRIDRPVDTVGEVGGRPADHLRFPRQWAAFQSQNEQVQQGTSLSEWAPLTKSEVLELKALNIHTVEQLAGLPDTALTWFGARQNRDKAKSWLEQATGGAGVTKLQAENEVLRGDVEMLKQQIKDLAALKTPDEPKRGPGRPPKQTGEE